MSMVRIEKGKHLIHKDDAQEKLEIILQGRVNMIVGDEVIPLDTGTIIGIAACEKISQRIFYCVLFSILCLIIPLKIIVHYIAVTALYNGCISNIIHIAYCTFRHRHVINKALRRMLSVCIAFNS